MQTRLKSFLLVLVLVGTSASARAQPERAIPHQVLLRIVRAEDERRWDGDLRYLMTSTNAAIRGRAALAAGRIGNQGALAELANMLGNDHEAQVRAMAAFAIGEIESPNGANALMAALKKSAETEEVRARAIEGLGKIAAALPKDQQKQASEWGAAILEVVKTATNRQTILLGITALLRYPANAGPTLASFLNSNDARIRADAANALARARFKDGNAQLVTLVTSDPDAVVRANAARVLGATEEKPAFEKLVTATEDQDARVRVSAIRALAALKDQRAADVLLKRGLLLTDRHRNPLPSELNECLEIANALGRLLAQTANPAALDWLHKGQVELNRSAPEVELAYVRVSPDRYLTSFGSDPETAKKKVQSTLILDWRSGAAMAQALAEIAALPATVTNKAELMQSAESLLRAMLDYKNSGIKINSIAAQHSEYAIPDVLRAYAAYKPQDLSTWLSSYLEDNDVVVRSTVADLLGDLPPSEENTRLLITALPRALDDHLNDAALSILNSLGQQKVAIANEAIKTALDSDDYLLRRRAVALLKANKGGDYSAKISTALTRNRAADYERALARTGKTVRGVVTTSKGSFTIRLLPDEAPLTVDNFIQLAKRGYYRGIVFHRVVPNFVIQGGDPRGDGNGGPGYAIRCEINEEQYDRGAVGMALSGKDTGGSQWFVTHSPQPHLDGGYTIFGQVISGMNVVDSIVRGDTIKSIVIQ
jgi:cyclophilin family peptidyl-prolyl cis-trans isomerase/HEAT repeat protein